MTNYKFRLATNEDVPTILAMAYDFYSLSGYEEFHKFDETHVTRLIKWYIEKPNDEGFVLVLDDGTGPVGFIAGLITMSLTSAEKIALEQIWWVDPHRRQTMNSIRLVALFEEWAKRNNCNAVTMSSIEGVTNVDKLYEKCGYTQKEKTFIKRLN